MDSHIGSMVLGIAGCMLLIFGLFAPAVAIGAVGDVNLVQHDLRGYTHYLIIALAVTGLLQSIIAPRGLMVTGLLALAVIGGSFIFIQNRVRSFAASADSDPLSAALFATRMSWGWAVLGAGAVLWIIAGVRSQRRTVSQYMR